MPIDEDYYMFHFQDVAYTTVEKIPFTTSYPFYFVLPDNTLVRRLSPVSPIEAVPPDMIDIVRRQMPPFPVVAKTATKSMEFLQEPAYSDHYKNLLRQLLTSMNTQQYYADYPRDERMSSGAIAHIKLLYEVVQDHGYLTFDKHTRRYRLYLPEKDNQQIVLVGKQEQPS